MRDCVLRLVRHGCIRRGPFFRVIEKVEYLCMRVLRQRFDQLAAPQNLQQLRWRRAGREQ